MMGHFAQHGSGHAFGSFNARRHEGLMLLNRRGMLKAGVAGVAGLTLPGLLKAQAEAAQSGQSMATGKSLVLLWMAGGPSQLDTWDSKPDRPFNNRGPFGVAQTKLPGVVICEHLPKQAAMLDKFTLIRSVDARNSNHEPNKVFQTGNLAAEARVNREAESYPALGSMVAKHHGPNHPSMPPYVAFMKSRSHLAFAGYLGKEFDPFLANQATKLPVYDSVGKDTGTMTNAQLFQMPEGLNSPRIDSRQNLMRQFDQLRRDLDQGGSMEALDAYSQQAASLLLGGRAQAAFDIDAESPAVRAKYGNHLWCQQALLARRLVEAGSSFVTLDLSYHSASGTWDTHGDNIPPYGGISKGLGPLLPLFDHLITTLVNDLDERGLLENTLVVAMGEFGRTPNMGTQDSTDGRNHWPAVMSMCLAGGGLRHGQVIGASEPDGGQIAHRPVTPGDLAATIFRHFGLPTDLSYNDQRGRPRFVVENGAPIHELF
jgi:uncharacterized protein (DUF1501 family)